MNDYISRDDVLKAIDYQHEVNNVFESEAAYVQMWETINDDRGIKAADVQPVKHGRWIEKPPYKDETVKGLEFQIVCSECDEQNCSLEFDENYNAIGKTFYRTRYCPNCGARMDGDTE